MSWKKHLANEKVEDDHFYLVMNAAGTDSCGNTLDADSFIEILDWIKLNQYKEVSLYRLIFAEELSTHTIGAFFNRLATECPSVESLSFSMLDTKDKEQCYLDVAGFCSISPHIKRFSLKEAPEILDRIGKKPH